MEPSESFEASIGRLEEIVKKLERGEAPLDQALSMFEEGTGLLRRCTKLLDEAELKVVRLMKGEDGAPVELPFTEVSE